MKSEPQKSVTRTLPVLLPLALDAPYHYALPEGMAVAAGSFVRVPLGGRDVIGVVWDFSGTVPENLSLRPVREVLSLPALGENHRRFLTRAAHWVLAPMGMVLRLALPGQSLLTPPKEEIWLQSAAEIPEDLRLTPQRRRLLEAAQQPAPAAELRRKAEISPSVLKSLLLAGALVEKSRPETGLPELDALNAEVNLSDSQQDAGAAIEKALAEESFSVSLLHGVTGSGKTELLFAALASVLARKKQTVLLLPEIALAAPLAARFRARFGITPDLWHSALPSGERRRVWHRVASGEAGLIIGARSALFLPFKNLGLIAVDEEHEAGFKQEDGVLYQGRDMALLRAQTHNIPALLSSATPALETLVNSQRHHWPRFNLKERHGEAVMPKVELVDMREETVGTERFISKILEKATRKALDAGQQVLFFLNRRGFAPLTLCRACGHRHECPHCSAWLVEHRRYHALLCHHCDHRETVPQTCPDCGSKDASILCGPGVERIAEEAAMLFPEARQAVLSRDMPESLSARQILLEEVAAGRRDLLIGTQILAKGLHLPNLTVAGILDADLGLGMGDLRAGERSAQLLQQAAGRAGRGALAGRVFVQTRQPNHPLMQALASGTMAQFLTHELHQRKQHHLPPYARLAALIISAPEEDLARNAAETLAGLAPVSPDNVAREKSISWLGPAPAALFRLRGQYRLRFLLRAGLDANMQGFLRRWRANWLTAQQKTRALRRARLVIDIDPYQFF